jgi:T4 RnlA family RNA ligase
MKRRVHKYKEFLNEGKELHKYLPTYEDCIELCSRIDSPFYETKVVLDGYNVSLFNYRLAQYSDFTTPLSNRPDVDGFEMRGLTFVFNKDGSVYRRFLLLEKFFNLNQTANSMYSVVKDYKIEFVNIKEDGSIASFIQLPNGKILGKSKMSFESGQAHGINNIFKSNEDVNKFITWCMNEDITPIMEYVAPFNRIVLPYAKEELILLRLRDNKTGDHLNIKDYLDKIGSIKIAPFIDDFKSLDVLVETSSKEEGKEGYVITARDKEGRNFFYKIKTPWYQALHGVLTNDLYRENTIIKYIIEDRIDDVLGQVPEDDKETHNRINRIIGLVKKFLYEKADKVQDLYDVFMKSDSVKQFALKYKNHPEFAFVMKLDKINRMKTLTDEEIIKHYGSIEKFEQTLASLDKYEQVKKYIETVTKRLEMARVWLKKLDPTIKFQDYAGDPDEN